MDYMELYGIYVKRASETHVHSFQIALYMFLIYAKAGFNSSNFPS